MRPDSSPGPAAFRRDCASARGAELATIADVALAEGKDYGIVTTTRITHATPATVYAHTPERDWESDEFMTAAHFEAGCVDIASQFAGLPPNRAPAITLGGGWREFKPVAENGKRRDGRDLVAEWLAVEPGRQYVTRAKRCHHRSTGARCSRLNASTAARVPSRYIT